MLLLDNNIMNIDDRNNSQEFEKEIREILPEDEISNDWKKWPGQSHQIDEEEKETDKLKESLDAVKKLEDFEQQNSQRERTDELVDGLLHEIQLEIEERYHEEDEVLIYGIANSNIFPAYYGDNEDSYVFEPFSDLIAERMAPLKEIYVLSETNINFNEIIVYSKKGMPEDIKNRMNEAIHSQKKMYEALDHHEEDGTYLFPVISEEEYSSLLND